MFAVFHIADFPLQAVLRTRGDLAGKPVALLGGEKRTALVLCLNELARARGVDLGLSAPQALARDPQLIMLTAHVPAEAEAQAALLAAAFTLSPAVEATAPGVATVDVSALAADRRGPAVQLALGQLEQLGLAATAGLARTPLLASYAAQRATPFLAVEDGRGFLAGLPLSAAEPSPEIAAIVSQWGVRTLGEFAALPKAEIARRLGAEGVALWERATGETTRPLRLTSPARAYTARMECENELETLEPLLFILRRFVDRLVVELANNMLAAAEMELTLHTADEKAVSRHFRLPEPTTDGDILFRALQSYLDTLRTESAVVAVELQLEPTRPLERQQGMFDQSLRDVHGFAESLARVVAIVGSDHVGTPRCENTHRADAVKLVPPAITLAPPAPLPLPPQGLPLRRYRPPLPAKVDCGPDAPAYVWTESVKGEVAASLGPWRSSGDWWESTRAWQCEEWDVELREGGVYRVSRTPEGWYLDGEYD